MDTVMDRGGSEAMTMNFMRHMDRSKVQYDFLVHREYKAAYEDEIEQLGGKIYRICPVYPQYFGRYKKEIRKFLKEHPEYKIIHSNTMELGYFAYKEASKQGVPVIICHSHCIPKGFNLKQIMRIYFKKRMEKYITHRFACSKVAGQWLFGEKYARDVRVIKNPIDAQQYIYDSEKRMKIRKEFGIKEDQFVVGHVGRFFPEKNHDFLIDIFSCIYQQNKNTLLMLVGSGETGDNDSHVLAIKEKVKNSGLDNSVIFTGVRSDVPELMQAMDAFVFPSKTEGLGIVLIEAQAAGLKCFTSEDVVPKDVQITELLSYISLKQPAKEWADNILSCQNGYERQNRYQEIVDAGFDILNNAKEMQRFYCDALKKR